MQQKIEQPFNQNNYLLSSQQQKQRLKCPNNNQANSVCISSKCLLPGLMCLDQKCECRLIHKKCHHILIQRVLESVEKHQKNLPENVKETYQAIYNMLNDMIQNISLLRIKFQRQEQYFGLKQEQLQLVQMINDYKINFINGKIISSLEDTFDIQFQINKNTKEQIIQDFQLKRKEFDKICKYVENSYLQIQGKSNKLSINIFGDSKIVQNTEEKLLLSKWIKQSFNDQEIKSQLIFRASQHGFSCKQFHKFCDGKTDTLVLVKNQYQKVIGGFSAKAWHSQNKNQFDETNRSFMFSLTLKQKYQQINKQKRSIFCCIQRGPTFGSGSDLSIQDKCNQNGNSFGYLGSTYNFKLSEGKFKYNPQDQGTKTFFTGNQNSDSFKVKQYQIYQIKSQVR